MRCGPGRETDAHRQTHIRLSGVPGAKAGGPHHTQPHEPTDGAPGLCEQEGVPCHLRMGGVKLGLGGSLQAVPSWEGVA